MTLEDEILARITVEQVLAPLDERDRLMLLMIWKIHQPMDYDGPWPPTMRSIGCYIGLRYEGRVLADSTIRYRRDMTLAALRRERAPLQYDFDASVE